MTPAPDANAPANQGMERVYPPQSPAYYLKLSVYWFSLSLLWGGMISIVIQTIVARISDEKKDIYLGWTLASGALVSTLIGLVIGTVSDRSRWRMGRRRPYIIVGSLLTIPSLLGLAVIGEAQPSVALLPWLMLAFCMIQFWANVATAPYQAFVPDLVPKDKQGEASAYMGMGSLVGQLGGLLLCGALISQKGAFWRICGTLSVVMFGAMLFTVFTIKERTATDNPAPKTPFLSAVAASFRVSPAEHRDFFLLILSRFVINMGFYTATSFLLYYVSDTLRAPDPSATVLKVFVISTVSGLLGNFPAGIFADRFSKKRIVYLSTAITALACLLFLTTNSIPIALASSFVFGAGFGAFQAVDWALATNLLPDYDEAKFMGIWHAAFTVPQVIAPLLGGSLAYQFNAGFLHSATASFGSGFGYRAVLLLVIVYLALGAYILRFVQEKAPTASKSSV